MTDFDEAFDWVVVGSGAGSLSSALVMRRAGKSVLILEKSHYVGGTTAKSGGVIWVPDNRFMKRDGIADSQEAAITYLDTLVGADSNSPGTSPERRRAYVVEAPRMIDFLVGQGIKLDRVAFWPDYYDELPGASKTSRTIVAKLFNSNELGPWRDRLRPGFMKQPAMLDEALQAAFYKQSWAIKWTLVKIAFRTVFAKLTGRKYLSAGAALQGRMLQAALKAGIDLRPETPVSEIIIEDGKAVGVATVKDGKPWRVGARLGVLVNAGGFARNQAMRDKYQPGTRAEWSQTGEGDTGDMHIEVERIGGVLAQMEEMVGYQCTLPPGWEDMYLAPPAQSLTAKPHAILVDQSGVRYMEEGGSYARYCKEMLARNKIVPAIPSWAIFDAYYLRKYMLALTMPGGRKPRSWYDEGYLRKADTIEELATILDIDPAVLSQTVDRWNGFVDKGVDEDFHRGERVYDDWLGDPFHKPSKSLGRIDQAPYYAVPVVPGDVGTYGGVITDAKARVLKADGTQILGLYATGVTTASVMGRFYPGAGASIGPSLTFGYIAAKHAADLDNQDI